MSDTGIRIFTPEKLTEAARTRDLAIFVGAGFSKNISSEIPDASQLISIAADHAKIDNRLLSIHTLNDYMLVGEYLEIEGKISAAISELAQIIHNPSHRVQNSRPHIQLTEIDCRAIFTTNWDSWIERAFEFKNTPHRVIRNPADLVSFHNVVSGSNSAKRTKPTHRVHPETTIIKYHGDFQDHGSIVFSISSYFDRIIEHSALDTALEAELLTKCFLFVGYSFSDPNFRLIWYKLVRQRRALERSRRGLEFPPSFLVASGMNPISTRWLASLGIKVIDVDPSPEKISASIEKLFDDIIESQR